MPAAPAQSATLFAHPDTPGFAVWGVAARVQRAAPGELSCSYTLRGDINRVRIPVGEGRRRRDGLWQHTCFEAFVRAEAAPAYYEFNFSPALDWAAYGFSDYRSDMAPAPLARAPGLHVHRSAEQLELTATVDLDGLPTLIASPLLHLALAAIVEEDTGRRSYWALQHGPGRPDFHDPEGFTLELGAR